jgi:cation diffusion facilitator family transporter
MTGKSTSGIDNGLDATRKERVALSSIAASAGITLAKIVAGLLSGSLALISEAAHAAVDTGATIITYLAVRTANKPPDEQHHYGHGKFESLAALAETIILFILATVVVIHAWDRLRSGGGEFEPTILAFVVLIGSIIVDLNRVTALRKVARETGSQALAADAMHFASDMVGSVLVLLGLLAGLAGFKYGDALAAMGVAAFIAIAGWRLGRSTIDTLLDRAPDGVGDQVRQIVASVPGVVEVERVRIRPGGTQVFGDITVGVSRTLPLDRVSQIKSQISTNVQAAVPNIAISVDAIPQALDDETILVRVLLTAAQRRTPIHHVIVQNVEGRLSVSMDMEVDARMSLGAAHAKATKLEAAIRDELGTDTEVETHIEPLRVKHLIGDTALETVSTAVVQALTSSADGISGLSNIHDIRVRDTGDGLVINYHCQFEANRDVAFVHKAVDELERRMRSTWPNLARIIGHAEPTRAAGVETPII